MSVKQVKQTKINENPTLLKLAETIAIRAKQSGFSDVFFTKNKKAFSAVSGFFGISQLQTALLCIMLNMSFRRSTIDLEMIADYIDIDPISAATYIPELEFMLNKKLLRRQSSEPGRRRRARNLNSLEYIVPKEILDALSKNEKLQAEEEKEVDQYELLSRIRRVFEDYYDSECSYSEYQSGIKRLLLENNALPFVKELNSYNFTEFDKILFLFLCTEILDNEESIDLPKALRFLLPEVRKQMQIRKEFILGRHALLLSGLVTSIEDRFRSDQFITLTEKGQEMIYGDDQELYPSKTPKKKSPDILIASEIPQKSLYFSHDEQEGIDFLADVLKPENHHQLVTRLEEAGMRTGVSVLLYGSPGTGKTESVYQLARKTGRDIRMVSISQTKNKYFGESERLIKKIFDDYRKMVEKSEVAPILLFNEADGVLSTRKNIGSSSVDQTENAIQNIILQEMEDLKGIMIATTNLTKNLDKAFERRFLYKILFEKPQPEIRRRIWTDKIPGLAEEYALRLANRFDFSGGQIENISRKCLMKKVLYNQFPCIEELERYCNEEEMTKPRETRKIGFSWGEKAV